MKLFIFIARCRKSKYFYKYFAEYQVLVEKYDNLTDEEKFTLRVNGLGFTSYGFGSELDGMCYGNTVILINEWLKKNISRDKFKPNCNYIIDCESLINLRDCINTVLTDNTRLNEIFPSDYVAIDLLGIDIIKELNGINIVLNSIIDNNNEEIELVYCMSK